MKTTRLANATRSGGSTETPWRERSLKHKENWRKLLLLGIQTGDKLAKPPFFVAYSRLCRHCRNLAEGGCRLSPFHFRLCRYFLGHVACRNVPWQGLFVVLLLHTTPLCEISAQQISREKSKQKSNPECSVISPSPIPPGHWEFAAGYRFDLELFISTTLTLNRS